jgi:hypothetical protein
MRYNWLDTCTFKCDLERFHSQEEVDERRSLAIDKLTDDLMSDGGSCDPLTPDALYEALCEITAYDMGRLSEAMKSEDATLVMSTLKEIATQYWRPAANCKAEIRIGIEDWQEWLRA